jgi:DNA-directed RNA polymerase specialized sigma24 family protein
MVGYSSEDVAERCGRTTEEVEAVVKRTIQKIREQLQAADSQNEASRHRPH